jgi:tight adherence protein C
MVSFIFGNFVNAPGAMALAGALALITGGLALIVHSYRAPRELLARRVDMVRPGAAFAVPDAKAQAMPSAEDPFRLRVRGMSEASQREIVRRFSGFGFSPGLALTYFAIIRVIVAAASGALVFLLTRNVAAFDASPLMHFAMAAIVAILGWFLPMMFIANGIRQRIKEVRSGLPDALELLVVCVEAGLSLEDGLDRVVNELRRSQPALADELGLTLADLRILPSRDQALANFAERVDVPSVRSVVTTLAQTLRYGTPLAQSLRVVAAEMRNDYLIDLEERANRLPAYLTLPVILFLMPTIFLIVGGPAVLRLLDAFQR